ncbi:hypothetical protein DL765_008764 [Monosporascus sp. GIB2]|nr:hypothetical protein DL765_008764 [Monosporascus sp. GIB2]
MNARPELNTAPKNGRHEISQDTPYDHKPLPSASTVRSVQLYPAATITDPLEFDFAYLDRYVFSDFSSINDGDGTGFYDAVSYVWGEPAFTHRIFCRGVRSYVTITAAVHDMLPHLRKRKRHRDRPPLRLWPDGICRHQADNAEKGVQVLLMGEIYHQARFVHIWLGGSEPDVGKTLRFLRTVALQRVQAQHRCGLADVVRAALREDVRGPSLGSRAEAAPQSVVPVTLHADLRLDGTMLKVLRVANPSRRNRGTLMENLWEFHTTVCLDPRDRVLALYGLAGDGTPQDVIDYSRPRMDTYTSVSRYWIQGGGGFVEVLRHLSAFGTLWEIESTPPSWVPNWSTERHHRLDLSGGLRLFDTPEFSGDLHVVEQYLLTAIFNPGLGPRARDVSTIVDILGLFCLALRQSGEARSPDDRGVEKVVLQFQCMLEASARKSEGIHIRGLSEDALRAS